MKRLLLGLSIILYTCAASVAQTVTMTVSNTGDTQRQECVSTDLTAVCQLLGVPTDAPLMVKNTFGQEVTYQKTYDGKLLLYAAVQPHSEAVFTITQGTPSTFKSFVQGKVYPERADDITWENDRGIYRVYGPALQCSGERSFGTDVWVKNTPELVVEQRYRMHMWGVGQRDSLKRIGKPVEANEIYMATSFHHDHGYGLDCYGVGPSLGCGAPALLIENGTLKIENSSTRSQSSMFNVQYSMLFPYCYQTYRILDNGPLRFTVELTYNTTDDGITEHRLISLDRGSHFNRMTVWYDGIKEPTTLATGVVLHSDDHLLLDKHYVLYADPTDNPKVHQSQIYVGVLFPEAVDETLKLKGEQNHGLGLVRSYKGEPYTYYFGSAWSNYDVRTFAQWQLTADDYLHDLKNPLTIRIQ